MLREHSNRTYRNMRKLNQAKRGTQFITVVRVSTISFPPSWLPAMVTMVQITLVSPLTRTGAPIPTAPRVGAAAITAAKRRKHRRYPELAPNRGGGQRLLVLACEIGGRWRSDCQHLLRLLLRHRARRTAAAVRAAARSGWQRRWWRLLSVALQQAVASTAQGHLWIHPQQPAGLGTPARHFILDLAPPAGPSRLPLRWRFTPTARMEKGAGEKKSI